MKAQLISEIQRKMLPYLNNEQLLQLKNVLNETFRDATVSYETSEDKPDEPDVSKHSSQRSESRAVPKKP